MVSSLEEIEHIVDEYSGMLYRIALHYVRTKSEAEDVVQEVYLRLIRSGSAFDGGEHEKAWLIRTTGQVCKDFLKTSWHKKTVSLQDNLPEADDAYAAEDPAPLEILPAVRKLPEKYRNVVYLYYYEAMPVSPACCRYRKTQSPHGCTGRVQS